MADDPKNPAKPQRPRGAKPTPKAKLQSMPKFRPARTVPSTFARIPPKLSYWLNNQTGDCVTAEEAFAKACHNPEIFIEDREVERWAKKNGFWDGAYLLEVMQAMAADGFHQDGQVYGDGTPLVVDYKDRAATCAAIVEGPVKIGVAANQLEKAVGGRNGWVLNGAYTDTETDHCVSLCGYGTMKDCCDLFSVPVPSGIDPKEDAYCLFTWNTIGVISAQSMVNITTEAWLRRPTTTGGSPEPAPFPPSPPDPTPAPSVWDLIVMLLVAIYKLLFPLLPTLKSPMLRAQSEGVRAIPWGQLMAIIALILSHLFPPPAKWGSPNSPSGE